MNENTSLFDPMLIVGDTLLAHLTLADAQFIVLATSVLNTIVNPEDLKGIVGNAPGLF
jgi:hypothetical protein